VLDLLVGDLEYTNELLKFWEEYKNELALLDLQSPAHRAKVSKNFELQLIQQDHSDNKHLTKRELKWG